MSRIKYSLLRQAMVMYLWGHVHQTSDVAVSVLGADSRATPPAV